jgi:hypothetical protein
VRVTPDDGYSYTSPAISPDGKFVAVVSDRGGSKQLRLKQLGGGDPIQITHSPEPVQSAFFFPVGTRLLIRTAPDNAATKSSLEVVPTLGGQSRVIATGILYTSALSMDGTRRTLSMSWTTPAQGDIDWRAAAYARQMGKYSAAIKDNLRVLVGQPIAGTCLCSIEARDALWPREWFARPWMAATRSNRSRRAIRAAGSGISIASVMRGDKVLFLRARLTRMNVWEIRVTPGGSLVRRANSPSEPSLPSPLA